MTTTAGKKLAAVSFIATKVAQECDKATFIMDKVTEASQVVNAMKIDTISPSRSLPFTPRRGVTKVPSDPARLDGVPMNANVIAGGYCPVWERSS